MTVLSWDKPKKLRSKEEWAEHHGFEDGPTGGYVPNMSDEDVAKWKAKLTGTKRGYPQVEIRRKGVVVIVNLGEGYNYKNYKSEDPNYTKYGNLDDYIDEHIKRYKTLDRTYFEKHYTEKNLEEWKYPTKGINVHLSTANPIQWTFEEINDLHTAIQEAKAYLEALESK